MKQFSVDFSGKDQSVLLSIVGQIVNGDIRIIEKPKQDNVPTGPKRNNYVTEENQKNNYDQQTNRT